MSQRVELFLARHWKWLGAAALACFAVSCAFTARQPDGSYATVGEDIIPGVTVGEDIVGAGVEAAGKVNPVEVVDKVQTGDWLGIGSIVLAVAGAFVGGIAARKKWRAKNAKVSDSASV